MYLDIGLVSARKGERSLTAQVTVLFAGERLQVVHLAAQVDVLRLQVGHVRLALVDHVHAFQSAWAEGDSRKKIS